VAIEDGVGKGLPQRLHNQWSIVRFGTKCPSINVAMNYGAAAVERGLRVFAQPCEVCERIGCQFSMVHELRGLLLPSSEKTDYRGKFFVCFLKSVIQTRIRASPMESYSVLAARPLPARASAHVYRVFGSYGRPASPKGRRGHSQVIG